MKLRDVKLHPRNFLLAAALLTAAPLCLTGCINDDEPWGEEEKFELTEGTEYYIGVNINVPSGTDLGAQESRAETYVGEFTESKITSMLFLFYNKNGALVGASKVSVATKTPGQTYRLTVNGIDLRNDFLDGSFYAGRSLKISGVPADDTKEVSGWTVKTTSAGKTSSVTYNTAELNLTMPDAQSVAVEPVIAEKSGINDIVADKVDTTRPVEVFDLYGRRVSDNASDLPAGIYVFRQGNKVYKQAVH